MEIKRSLFQVINGYTGWGSCPLPAWTIEVEQVRDLKKYPLHFRRNKQVVILE